VCIARQRGRVGTVGPVQDESERELVSRGIVEGVK